MNPTAIPSIEPASDAQAATPKPRRGRKASPLDLLKLAASNLGTETKTAARAVLTGSGFIANAAAIESLFDTINFICNRKHNRLSNRILARLGHLPPLAATRGAASTVKLPRGTPASRLLALRKTAVIDLAKNLFRHGAPGGTSFTVSFAVQASDVDYEVQLDKNWDVYKGSFKGWAANVDVHRIRVPADWRLRVQRKGLANLGGLMTLDAHPLLVDGGIELFAATWAQQERGYGISVTRGYIARMAGEHFHASSRDTAIEGVRRKLKKSRVLGTTADGASAYDVSIEAFIQRYAGLKLEVSLDDARTAGACDFGIRSWCAAVGLSYEAGRATLKQVLDCFRIRPQQEVRSAVLQAVRRHRAAASLVDASNGDKV